MLTATIAWVVAALVVPTIVIFAWTAGLAYGLVATSIVGVAIYHRWREQVL